AAGGSVAGRRGVGRRVTRRAGGAAAVDGRVRDAGVAAEVEAGVALEAALAVRAGRGGVVRRGALGVARAAVRDVRQGVDARVAAQVRGGRRALVRAGPAFAFADRADGRRARAARPARAAALGARQVRLAPALGVAVAVGAVGRAGVVDDARALHARYRAGAHALER